MKFASLLQKALIRIVPVALAVGLIAAAVGHWHAQNVAEESDIRMLTMEAGRAVPAGVLALPAARREAALNDALKGMVGGMFAIATVYSADGKKIAEAVQPGFEEVGAALGTRARTAPAAARSYDSMLILGQRVLRVFIPLAARDGETIGHLEGLRVVGASELSAYRRAAVESALIAAFSVLLCAALLAPLLIGLAARNLNWARAMTEAHLELLETLGRAIAKRDSETGTHNYRVTWMAARLGEELGLGAAQLRSLIAGSVMHDIGKIGIPDAILLKHGKLDDREQAIMQAHVEIGGHIAGNGGFLHYARDVIEGHHERWDGSGYPRHRAGEAIPLNTRIFSIADVYDALRAKRPYKDSLSFKKSIAIMREGRGTHFDPQLLDVFEGLVHEFETRIINASEAQLVKLTRHMARKHFLSDVNDYRADASW